MGIYYIAKKNQRLRHRLHPKIPRLLHCQNRLWFLQYISLSFGFRVLKSNQIVLLHCPDMVIPSGVIPKLNKKIVLQKVLFEFWPKNCLVPKIAHPI